jgi:sugar lactone lactonase YvrE/thiol-disulfide isomerase/thioredoxin
MFAVKRRYRAAASVLAAAILFMSSGHACGGDAPFAHRQKVPPLPEGITWLNTAGPLEWRDFRGKFVLVDFWAYCCINCMHILPELKQLEHAYPKNLVVVGVHSAKFAAEQDAKNISNAILRYKIEHPVINDAQHILWDRFGVNVWPTVFLIDPEGYLVWGTTGEITFAQVDRVLRPAVAYYRKKGLLDERPIHFNALARGAVATPLRFPGKIIADAEHGQLFVSDSNHNRIVVLRPDGTLVTTIGSGTAGLVDGSFTAAQFNGPQGMALSGRTLFVADTENHAIRRADFDVRRVTTIAGAGRQGRESSLGARRGDPRKVALNSPWDLAIHGDDLYIAMAGYHQIWKMRLHGGPIGPYAGNGREDIVDGAPLPRQAYQLGYASFAQPSGLACDGTWLYVADSEGSSIRAVPLDARREVRTVVGTSHLAEARLFTFGDVDGAAGRARFQHPLGLALADGQLYVADTYNNKIKAVDPATGAVRTVAGDGKAGRSDYPPRFNEPGGLCAAFGKLFVADTDNHLLRSIDLHSGKVQTLAIRGL